jgi:hypothetical protein
MPYDKFLDSSYQEIYLISIVRQEKFAHTQLFRGYSYLAGTVRILASSRR